METLINIKNFRSIGNASFAIKPGLNVLVGSNGSGKTNILSALKFVSSLLMSGAAVAMGRAGGPQRNFKRGADKILFSVVTPYERSLYKGKVEDFQFHWDISIALSKSNNLVQLDKELIRVTSTNGAEILRMEVSRTGGVFRSSLHLEDENKITKKMINLPGNYRSGTKKSDLYSLAMKEIGDRISGMRKAPPDASLLPMISWLHDSVGRLIHELTSFDEYNIQPETARQATDPLPQTRMETDGRGVSEVISALESQQLNRLSNRRIAPYYADPYSFPYWFYGLGHFGPSGTKKNALQEITEHFKTAISTVDEVGTEIDPSTGRRYVVFRSGDLRFRPEEVSDGTIKWLCLLVALFVPQSRVILLEEPENFMHPWMQQKFINLAREQAKKLRTSIIITTHSATVLNALLVDELLIVKQGPTGTEIEAAADKNDLQSMLDATNFGLGDIWVSGGIGGVVGG